MTTLAAERLPESQQKEPGLKRFLNFIRQNIILIYSLDAMVFVPLLAVIMMLQVVMDPFSQDLITESQAFQLAVPLLAAAGVCVVFGVLLAATRRRWAAIGCAVGGVAVTLAWLVPQWLIFGSLTAFVTNMTSLTVYATPISFVLVPLLLVGTLPAVLSDIDKKPLLDLTLPSKIHKVGTLRYTAFGLFMVFIWLLWGDFIWTLLDGCIPGILPLKLNDMHASDMVNQVLNKTLAYSIAFLFAPAVSFRSDRHRGKWGRRMPFMIWTTPLVGLFLILIGCYQELTNAVTGGAPFVNFLGWHISHGTVSLMIFGALFIGFDFANIFVGTVYWYLFNDVVPSHYLSRFLSLFRIAGTLAGIAYNHWIYAESLDHFQIIFIVAGVAYIVGFTAMCFFVKEGSYPPPPPNIEVSNVKLTQREGFLGQTLNHILSAILSLKFIRSFVDSCVTFAKECFTHRLYWFFFLANTCFFMTGLASNTFMQIRNLKTLNLTMTELATMGEITLWVSLILQYPAGWLADRWNPIRIFILTSFLCLLGTLAGCVLVFTDFGPSSNWVGQWLYANYGWNGNLVYMYITALLFMPFGAINGAAELPMYMRLLPKSRYGQFCSANAMIRSFAMIFGSIAAGWFIGMWEDTYHMGDWRYRFVTVWTLIFQIPQLFFLVLLYRQWKTCGGDKSYAPPGLTPNKDGTVEVTAAHPD